MYNFLSYLIYLTVVNNRYLIHGNQKLQFGKCYSSCNHYLKQIKTLGSCLSCYNKLSLYILKPLAPSIYLSFRLLDYNYNHTI